MRALALIQGLYDYHFWANRRLFEVAQALPTGDCDREMGAHFSEPTVQRMLGHIYGADRLWLSRWIGVSPTRPPGVDITQLDVLRRHWDELEAEQRAFVEGLREADLERVVEFRLIDGRAFRLALWPLLQHVPNHATHHRSELATMLTLISGSPPDSGIATYHYERTGQRR
jgi:uncharacterized damage-inducible protein DinB